MSWLFAVAIFSRLHGPTQALCTFLATHAHPGAGHALQDIRMVQFEAERIVAAAVAALVVPPAQRNFDEPVLLNTPVLRCNYSHVMGNLKDDCAVIVHSKRA